MTYRGMSRQPTVSLQEYLVERTTPFGDLEIYTGDGKVTSVSRLLCRMTFQVLNTFVTFLDWDTGEWVEGRNTFDSVILPEASDKQVLNVLKVAASG